MQSTPGLSTPLLSAFSLGLWNWFWWTHDEPGFLKKKCKCLISFLLALFIYLFIKEHNHQQMTCSNLKMKQRRCQVLGSMPCFRVVTFSLPLDSCVIWYHGTDRGGKHIFTYLANMTPLWGFFLLLISHTYISFKTSVINLIRARMNKPCSVCLIIH